MKITDKDLEAAVINSLRSNQNDPYWDYVVRKNRQLGFIDGLLHERAKYVKLVEALKTALDGEAFISSAMEKVLDLLHQFDAEKGNEP